MRSELKVLLCGMGSIGERHARNLMALGVRDIAVVRRQGSSGYRTLEREFTRFTVLDEALARFRPHLTIVCNPTSMHVESALLAARAGSHVLVEKPLGNRLEHIDELERALAGVGRKGMVAYMQRFHPLNRKVREWLEQGDNGPLGSPVYYHAEWGEYLPDWHPWEDYRESYAARRDLGGGPALTLSHEFDMALWLFGKPDRCLGMAGRASELRLKCEHSTDALLGYPGGLVAHIHLDYVQRPPRHRYSLVGTRGRVEMDYVSGELILERNPGGDGVTPPDRRGTEREIHLPPEGFDRNAMFLAELDYLLDCLEQGDEPRPNIAEGRESVRLALECLEGSVNA